MNETKKHILKVTFGLFLQKNFKEVTMKEIVEKTGLSKGAFYHYFESKEQLFHEVVEFFFANMVNHHKESHAASSLQEYYISNADRFDQAIPEVLLDGRQPHEMFNLNFFSLIFDALKLIPGFQEQMQTMHTAEKNQWIDKIAMARNSGEIQSSLSDEQIAGLFMFSADGLTLSSTLYGTTPALREELLTMWHGIYAMIRA